MTSTQTTKRAKFKMPRKAKRRYKCDGCGRRSLSSTATVKGIYVYCPKCVKAQEKAERKK